MMRNKQVRDWCECEQAALDARVAVLARARPSAEFRCHSAANSILRP